MSKQPKWKEEWDRLVGDNKYLEIKGWYSWQEKNYTTDYIRDYYGKDEDPDYYMKPVLQRWMMDWLRRHRGRLRHTLPNDPVALLKRMNINDRAEWAQAPRYLLALVGQPSSNGLATHDQGFLIPTNEPVRDQKWVNKTKLNNTTTAGVVEEVEAAGETPVPPVSKYKTAPREKAAPISVDIAAPAVPVRKSLREWDKDISPYSAEQIRQAIVYHLNVHKNAWYRENLSEGYLRRGDNLKKMIEDVPEAHLRPKQANAEPYRWKGNSR
jgi:hypothetical protein